MIFINNFFRTILIYFFSYDNSEFYIKNIYPKKAILGEKTLFTLTVSNSRKFNHIIKISNSYMNCIKKNILKIECFSLILFSNLNDFKNLTKGLTINDLNTNLFINIEIPKKLKVLSCLKKYIIVMMNHILE